MSEVVLHRDDLEAIREFAKKHAFFDYMTISVDSSSGIGSIVKVSMPTIIDGDTVVITKTIVDESSW